MQKPVVCADGKHVPCFGDVLQLSIRCNPKRVRSSVSLQKDILMVRVASLKDAEDTLVRWYQKEALAYCVGQAHEYADMLGTAITQVRVISMKTQWGSCNSKARALSFNWKLALAPEDVARYVVAHEVAHILEPNHSPSFWKVVRKLDPDYALHRTWLRQYGGGLYIAESKNSNK